MQIVKLSVPVPSIGPAVDVHVRLERSSWQSPNGARLVDRHALNLPDAVMRAMRCVPTPATESVAFAAAYDRQAGAWVLPETPESVAELLAAAGVVLR